MNSLHTIKKTLAFGLTVLWGGASMLEAERYSFALIPSKEHAKQYVVFATTFFKSYSHNYFLSENSLPHITLCQFETTKDELCRIKNSYDRTIFKKHAVDFTGLSFIEGAGDFEGVRWIELAVKRDKKLMDLQKECIDFLDARDISPLNEVGVSYRPHLTLANTTLDNIFGFTLPKFSLKAVPFKVHLIKNDENWQCINIESSQESAQ
jgi:2'-5' RNA ligase